MTFFAAAGAFLGTAGGAAAIGGAGLLGGALISSNASKSAADTQQQSSRDATAAQVGMFNTQVGLQEPWRQAGIAGLGKLNTLLGLTPQAGGTPMLTQGADGVFTASTGGLPATAGQNGTAQDPSFGTLARPFTAADFTADPGYQFRQDQQRKALTAAASAQGGFGSGKYLKDAMTYSGNLASQEYGNAYNRFNTDQTNQFNRFASVSGIGQTSANTLTGAAGTLGGQIGSNITGAGNAAAAGQVGSANALNGAIGQGASMYQTNSLINALQYRPTAYGAYAGSPMSGLFYGNGSLGD